MSIGNIFKIYKICLVEGIYSMKGKINKAMALSTAAVITLTMTSPVTIVSAKPRTANELYKDAYNLMTKALEERTQQSVNAARKAINLLIGTDAGWAVGEFSKQVDTVQEELFVRFMSIIYYEGTTYRKESLTIDEINEARALVNDFSTYEGNKAYITTWSSVVDNYIQVHISDFNQYYDTLLRYPVKKNKDTATRFLNEIAGIKNNESVAAFVNTMRQQVEGVQLKANEDKPFVIKVDTYNIGLAPEKIASVTDSKGAATKDIDVSYKKLDDSDIQVTIRARKAGDYRVTFTYGNEKGYMLISVSSDFSVDVKYSRCAMPIDNSRSVYLDNDIETLGLVVSDKTTITSTNPEIASIECNTNLNKIRVTSKAAGTDIVKITNGQFTSYLTIMVGGDEEISTWIERPRVDVLDQAHKGIDFSNLMSIKDSDGKQSDGIYICYDMDCLEVEAYKEGDYVATYKDSSDKEINLYVTVASDGTFTWHW